MIHYAYLPSPLGSLLVSCDEAGLRQLTFDNHRHPLPVQPDWVEDAGKFSRVKQQLDEYFAGQRQQFDLPLSLRGTDFQQQVWQALTHLPHGKTTTYAELAKQIGRPDAVRAVGTAVGRNPVSIIVPCHRVLATSGALAGYAGGLDRKSALLRLEGVLLT